MDKLKLLMGRPLIVSKEHSIYAYQPLISEIVDMGEDYYGKLVFPFVLTTSVVFDGLEKEEELIEKYHLWDLFFTQLEDGSGLLDGIFGGDAIGRLIESLQYFLKVEDIQILKHRKKIIINNCYTVDKNEFDVLRLIIQSITNRSDIEVEKPPKNMRSKRKRDIWNKLQAGRRREAEKNAIHTQDIINYVMYGGKSFIPYSEIDKMTYHQLSNAYKSVLGTDAFNVSMGYKLSQKYDVKDEVPHWTKTLKIGK